MNLEQQINAALDFLEAAPNGRDDDMLYRVGYRTDRGVEYNTKGLRGVARLRMDYEAEEGQEGVREELVSRLVSDLEDLIENGDTEHRSDPLYKALDGSKKRGVSGPKVVEIINAAMAVESKPKKKTIEYTVWINLYTEW